MWDMHGAHKARRGGEQLNGAGPVRASLTRVVAHDMMRVFF